MHIRLCAAIAAMIGLTGCQAPMVSLHNPSFQPKVEYANDWSNLADKAATKFRATLHTDAPAVYVMPGPSDMPFAAAFRTELEQALIRTGYPVVETPQNAVVLNFSTQTFLYNGEQKLPLGPAPFTSAGIIYAVATQLRHVSSIDTGAAIAGGVGPIADLLYAINDKTNAEVLLTLEVTDGTHVHYLDTQSFYVQPADLTMYWSQTPDLGPMPTPSSDQRLAVVMLPVTR